MSNLSERLSELMFDEGLNMTQLGNILGCGEAAVSRYCAGAALPTYEFLIKIADYFKVTCDFVLGLEDESKAKNFAAPPPFDKQFKKVCEEYKISRYKLRKKTGIAESVMRYWAQGKTKPSVPNLILLAEKGFGCTVDFLVGREI